MNAPRRVGRAVMQRLAKPSRSNIRAQVRFLYPPPEKPLTCNLIDFPISITYNLATLKTT